MISMHRKQMLGEALEAVGMNDEKVDRLIEDLLDVAALEPVKEERARVVVTVSLGAGGGQYPTHPIVRRGGSKAPVGEPWYESESSMYKGLPGQIPAPTPFEFDDDPTEEWGEDHARD